MRSRRTAFLTAVLLLLLPLLSLATPASATSWSMGFWANQYPFDTGVVLVEGETATITANGTWNVGGTYGTHGPEGTSTPNANGEMTEPGTLVPSAPVGALVGSTDGGVSWVFLGAGPTPLSGPGNVLLAANDTPGNYTDNTGSMNITVEWIPLSDQDQDGKHIPDDNCPDVWNWDQADSDADGVGDACEVPDAPNTAPVIANPSITNPVDLSNQSQVHVTGFVQTDDAATARIAVYYPSRNLYLPVDFVPIAAGGGPFDVVYDLTAHPDDATIVAQIQAYDAAGLSDIREVYTSKTTGPPVVNAAPVLTSHTFTSPINETNHTQVRVAGVVESDDAATARVAVYFPQAGIYEPVQYVTIPAGGGPYELFYDLSARPDAAQVIAQIHVYDAAGLNDLREDVAIKDTVAPELSVQIDTEPVTFANRTQVSVSGLLYDTSTQPVSVLLRDESGNSTAVQSIPVANMSTPGAGTFALNFDASGLTGSVITAEATTTDGAHTVSASDTAVLELNTAPVLLEHSVTNPIDPSNHTQVRVQGLVQSDDATTVRVAVYFPDEGIYEPVRYVELPAGGGTYDLVYDLSAHPDSANILAQVMVYDAAGLSDLVEDRTSKDTLDSDLDGIADSTDPDDDNDGVADTQDAFPNDPTESVDSDSDGTGDSADPDDDNDGVADTQDAFPNDPTEWLDTDSDGTGNNTDLDDDNDGAEDANDAFPNDPTEWLDTDGDLVGDIADPDDDNDGVSDSLDAFPYDFAESADLDGDGIGDVADADRDGDGSLNSVDSFPNDPSESVDSDSDGVGDNSDPTPNGDPAPVPTTNPAPVPTTDPVPLPTTNPVPVPTTGPVPVPTTDPVPVPTSNPAPVPTTSPAPVPVPVPTAPSPAPEPPAPGPTAAPIPTTAPAPTTEPVPAPVPSRPSAPEVPAVPEVAPLPQPERIDPTEPSSVPFPVESPQEEAPDAAPGAPEESPSAPEEAEPAKASHSDAEQPADDPRSGSRPELEAGESLALLDGNPAPATVEVLDTVVRISSGSAVIDIEAISGDGSVLRPGADATLRVDKGGRFRIKAKGFSSRAELVGWVFSEPRRLGSTTADESGSAETSYVLPADLPGGSHTLQLNGASDEGMRSISIGLDLDASGMPIWQALDHPEVVASTQIALLALVSIASLSAAASAMGGVASFSGSASAAGAAGARGAGAAAARGASTNAAAKREEEREKGKIAGAKIKHLKTVKADMALGDRSLTWRMPGHERLDGLSQRIPVKVAPYSPLLARLIADGSHLRAVLGVIALVSVPVGAAVGVAAALSGNGLPAPSAPMLGVGLVVGIIDGLAGFSAAVAFLLTLLITGAFANIDDVRGAFGVAALMFALPLMAAAMRPLRRSPSWERDQLWYRAGDYVVLPALLWFATSKLVGAFPGLYGHKVGLLEHADTLALVVVGALLVRLLIEEVATRLYPERLLAVSPEKVPWPSKLQSVCAIALKGVLFAFVAAPFVGVRPELWIGLALFVIPQLLRVWESSLPKWRALYFIVPRGVVKLTAMMVIGFYSAILLGKYVSDPAAFIGIAFVVLALPGTIEGIASLLVDEPDEDPTWRDRVLGLLVCLIAAPAIWLVAF